MRSEASATLVDAPRSSPGLPAAADTAPPNAGRAAALRLLRRVGIFALVNAVLIACTLTAAAVVGERHHYGVGDSASVLLTIPENHHYDYLLMGPSHSMAFSWGGNHALVSKALGGADIANISNQGAGPMVEDLYLQYFLKHGDTARTAVLFAHPFSFFSSLFNDDNRFTGREPIRSDFLAMQADNGVSLDNLFFYFQSKISPEWVLDGPFGQDATAPVPDTSPARVEMGNNRLYPSGVAPKAFAKYAPMFRRSVERLRAQGIRVVIVVPPTLLGTPKGIDIVKPFLEDLARQPGVEFHDLTGTVTDPRQFQDLSHLNRDGVLWFTTNVLKPILDTPPAH